MNSLVTLSRLPVLGLNSEYRLRAAYAQQPNEDACFVNTKGALINVMKLNTFVVAGCIPGISLFSGAYRIHTAYSIYQASIEYAKKLQGFVDGPDYSPEEKADCTAQLQEREWTAIQMGALGVAEMCQLSIILAVVHFIKTVFDHGVAACNQPEEDAKLYNDFEECLASIEQLDQDSSALEDSSGSESE